MTSPKPQLIPPYVQSIAIECSCRGKDRACPDCKGSGQHFETHNFLCEALQIAGGQSSQKVRPEHLRAILDHGREFVAASMGTTPLVVSNHVQVLACEACAGTGAKDGTDCATCEGSGMIDFQDYQSLMSTIGHQRDAITKAWDEVHKLQKFIKAGATIADAEERIADVLEFRKPALTITAKAATNTSKLEVLQ